MAALGQNVEDINIKIKLPNNEWVPARDYQTEAFLNFKRGLLNVNQSYNYNNGHGITFAIKRIGNEHHGGIHIIRDDKTTLPIADFNDVKIFILDCAVVEWYGTRNYQTWAYFNFIYGTEHVRKYKSKGTYGHNDHIEIPINGLQPGIIFLMSRNDNGTIFYERNDNVMTKVRISDNEQARRGYLGFYRRITGDFGPTVVHNNAHNQNTINTHLQIPHDVQVSVTSNENYMCIICNNNKKNIQFVPCNHTHTCSQCYMRLDKPTECPICKQNINSIVKYTPT
jgi:hypothetical protein